MLGAGVRSYRSRPIHLPMHARRYQEYLRQAAGNSLLFGVEPVARAARDAIAGTPIASPFPAAAKLLLAYGPTACVEDLPEYPDEYYAMSEAPLADAQAELDRSGLTAPEIASVLKARGFPAV